jgi:hypothetical protein
MYPSQFCVVSYSFSFLDPLLQITHVSSIIVPHVLLLLKLKKGDENEKIIYGKKYWPV